MTEQTPTLRTISNLLSTIEGLGSEKLGAIKEKAKKVGWSILYKDLLEDKAEIPGIGASLSAQISEKLKEFRYDPTLEIGDDAEEILGSMTEVDEVLKFKEELKKELLLSDSDLVSVDRSNLEECRKQYNKVKETMKNTIHNSAAEVFQEEVLEKILDEETNN